MAAYSFLASEPTLQVLSADLVRDAQRVTARAAASQVVFSLLFAPYPTDPTGSVIWTDSLIDQQLDLWAGYWDANASVPGVAGISVGQDVDVTGTLRDVATVYITSATGNSTAQLSLHGIDFLPDHFAPAVAAARAQLDAVEQTDTSTADGQILG